MSSIKSFFVASVLLLSGLLKPGLGEEVQVATLDPLIQVSAENQTAFAAGEFLTLCYHDIPKTVTPGDPFGVDQATFIETVEYLLQHNYHFVGMKDILSASKGESTLPDQAVLLTFDDGYRSFHDFVWPMLKHYQIPSVLSVVSEWLNQTPPDIKQEVMTWEMLQEISRDSRVEIAAHTHNLHKGLRYNPQGNEASAAVSRKCDAATGAYESEEDYRTRIRQDMDSFQQALEAHLGRKARVMTWPYGRYNQICMEEAAEAGMNFHFALDNKISSLKNLPVANRILMYKNPSVLEFSSMLKRHFLDRPHHRVIQLDLDLIYDPDPEQTEKNLGRVLDRIKSMKVSRVWLQAFSDLAGTGDVKEVYFPNSVLPMRSDLLCRVIHQLRSRAGVFVYAWMPAMSFVLPNAEGESLRVLESKRGHSAPSSSWYKRLSIFHPEAREKILRLYRDLAVHCEIDGVVFQDDAYLNDFEDFSPHALAAFKQATGVSLENSESPSPDDRNVWTAFKTDSLIQWTDTLLAEVRKYRPECLSARTLYAPVLLQPESEEWFAQNYQKSLDAYDFTVIMAYPRMEKVKKPIPWLKNLVREAARHPQGLEKTIFKLQAYDWERKQWIPSKKMYSWMRTLVAEGARHLAYYPDDYTVNQPQHEGLRTIFSLEDFPFKRN